MQEIVNGNPRLRRILYVAYALAGLVLGSIAVGYGAADTSLPTWLPVALAVYAYLGGAFGFGAQSKVDATPIHAPRTAGGAYRVTDLED